MKSGKRSRKKKEASKRRPRARAVARARRARAGRPPAADVSPHELSAFVVELSRHSGASPIDSGGDVDADWQRGQSVGEEAVGGTVATPDQDGVDELARPLGVERGPQTPVISSETILSARDRRRWRIEKTIDEQAEDADA